MHWSPGRSRGGASLLAAFSLLAPPGLWRRREAHAVRLSPCGGYSRILRVGWLLNRNPFLLLGQSVGV